ncbi:glycosyltransferase [Treponema primitia]|uniref:glycosyltransferase n=1 Tax=Treponema primitia TaxID=88058 RepID=UPI0039800482
MLLYKNKRQIDNLILSFTSFPARLQFIEYTLFSIIQQTIRPKKIILWLSSDEFPKREKSIPENVLRYKPFNFKIQFVEKNFRSYKKLIYSLEKYPDDIIVTFDDDIYYKPDWLEKLYSTYSNFPNDIISHRVHAISFKNNHIDLYQNWSEGKIGASFLNFFTGAGGILYPPRSLYDDAVKSEYFMNLCPSADDIWFYVMALLQKTLIRKVKNGYDKAIDFDYVFDRDYVTIPKLTNINLDENRNDIQFKAVLEHYGIYESFYALYGGNTCY